VAVLGNAAALADELLPRLASKLVPGGLTPELKDWKRKLQRAVDKLKDHLCKQVVLHFFLADDAEGESKLSPSTYLDMDNDSSTWHEDPNTSPMFQSLFIKLTSMHQTAMEVLIGRERVAHLLLMRLAETFVIWLSNDQEFWDTIEQGPRSLGAIGLQQVSHPQFFLFTKSFKIWVCKMFMFFPL
jgi:hypothetical protein